MHQTISEALSQRGYDRLTPVQEAVTAPELVDRDLLVSAQTGSGKTVGFGLAIAPTLLAGDDALPAPDAPLALVVAPTRELALQVSRELGWLYAGAGGRVTTCVGGMDMRDERRALERGAHLVVGTPGRLRDHIQRGSLDMTGLRAIVLDEADEMLDLGFREDLEFMLGEAPADRRTLLFSATVPPMIAKLAAQFQRDAVRVSTLGAGSQHADIEYHAVRVAPQDTETAIVNLLRYRDAENAIVFANTRAMVNRLAARLSNRGFPVVALSGELSQADRSHALQAMRDGRARVCVATDVAARGIDLPKLELVIHAELPANSEGLLHRSGRTGRAGRKGVSALIVPPKSVRKAERLMKVAKIAADWIAPPSAEDVHAKDEERLLTDPVWSAVPTPEQSALAARLLALHGPEKIATAFLSLHQARLSAPEDLADPDQRPDQRPEPKVRAPFGPSAWVALSVGCDRRAEPRWLLPLLCRAGGLDREMIGAIRIQPSESHVELKAAALPGFLAAIGEAAMLEDGISVRQLDAAPDRGPEPRADLGAAPGLDAAPDPAPRPAPDQGARPIQGAAAGRGAKATTDAPAPSPAPAPGPSPARKPAGPRPTEARTQGADRSARPDTPPAAAETAPPRKPRSKAKADPAKTASGKPAAGTRKAGGRPHGKAGAKPWRKDGPDAAKPAGKPKPKGKAQGKTQGKPPGKQQAKPQAPAGNPADTSKRFTPPGAAGKAGKRKPPAARGKAEAQWSGSAGDAPPRKPRSTLTRSS